MGLMAEYQETELGQLPSDWQVVELGSLNPFVTSGSRGWARYYAESGDAFVRITNLSRDLIYIDFSDLKQVRLPVDGREGLRTRLQTGDLLVSITADIGIVGYVDQRIPNPTYINQHIALVRCDPSATDTKFLAYYLASARPQRAFRAGTDQGAKAGMSLAGVLKIRAAFPNVREQRAIAAALSDVDALLDGLDRLIAKKRALKQAAMQQLLTGQTRLPGFSGPWAEKRLGALGEFTKGSGVRKSEANTGSLPCVRYGELYTHHENVVREFYSSISVQVASTAMRLQQGDVLFAGSGETKEEIGKCAAFTSNAEAYAGGDIVILRGHGQQPTFMGYYLNAPAVAAQKASRGQGDAVVHISARGLGDIVVRLPSVDEQTAIARVLSDIDAELTALESRRDKTRSLKKAMMEELLTGKTRLVKGGPGV